MKVAVIGCGFFSRNHLMAWRSLEGAEIVGVCDRDEGRANAASSLAGAPAFIDAAAMLEAVTPDVADIVTTATSHLALAELCAAKGVGAVIQKPMAPSLGEAAAIADLQARTGVQMMVHENFRFQAPIRLVRALIDSGRIGRVHYGRIAFRNGYDILAGQPYLADEERFVLMDVGVHVLDVARFLLGEIDSLSCRTQQVRTGIRGEDMASVLVGFASGAMGVVEASYSSFAADDPFPETLVRIEGERGSITLDRGYRISLFVDGVETVKQAEPPCPDWGEPPWHVVQDSVVAVCRHWLDRWTTAVEPETSVADNLKTLAAVEASYRSAATYGALMSPAAVLDSARRGPAC